MMWHLLYVNALAAYKATLHGAGNCASRFRWHTRISVGDLVIEVGTRLQPPTPNEDRLGRVIGMRMMPEPDSRLVDVYTIACSDGAILNWHNAEMIRIPESADHLIEMGQAR